MKNKKENNTKVFLNNYPLFFKGFVMGIAEVVPGVSGSTLALVMKIYFAFISFLYQISNFLKEVLLFLIFKSNIKKVFHVFKKIDMFFGIFLFSGMFLAILLFSNIMSFLFEEYRDFVLAFFFGLVLSSIIVPWSSIKERSFGKIMLFVLSFLVFFLILSLKPYVFSDTPSPLYFLFGGSVAICAMVLPGISGSFVFLMLGLYEYIVGHISNFTKLNFETSEVLNIAFLFVGIVLGFSIFVRILQNALKSNSDVIFAILAGIMLASLRVLWIDFSQTVVLPLLALAGFGVVFFLRKLG